jgi:hypothetical protein
MRHHLCLERENERGRSCHTNELCEEIRKQVERKKKGERDKRRKGKVKEEKGKGI